MPKTRAIQRAKGRKLKAVAASAGASANDVLNTLAGLFADLGIDVSYPTLGAESINGTPTTAHTMYSYASAVGAMLAHWHQHPEYLDADGNPARIQFGGKGPSFRSLARLKAPKIDVSYLLSELERLGAVSVDDGRWITVHTRSFPVYADRRLAVQHTLNALDGFVKTLRHNLGSNPSNSDQLFHRIARNDDFDSREIATLKVRVKRHGQSFLDSFDDWLMWKTPSKARRKVRGSSSAKVSVGVYLSVESKK